MVNFAALTSAFGLASLAVASPLLVERQLTQPLQFGGFGYEGEGCPPGSLIPQINNGNETEFTLIYKELKASIGPNEPKVKVKCQIWVEFNTTASTQLVVASGDFKGKVNIEKGVYGKQQNQIKFAGNPGVSNFQWEFKGPANLDTTFTNALNATLTSGCSPGGHFKMILNNYLTLTSQDGGSGTISVSELDAELKQSMKIATKQC